MKQQYLEIGQIVAAHGLKGEVRVYPWCDDPQFLAEFDTLYLDKGKKPLEVERARVQKNMVILKIAGINTVEETVPYRTKILYMNREDAELPEGTYYVEDLLGLSVYDVDTGVCYGILTDVEPTGANDVYTVKGEDGRERLIPAIPQVVLETDIEAGKMLIRPLEGLFDD